MCWSFELLLVEQSLVVLGRAFTATAHDGHTLTEQPEQAAILMPAKGQPTTVYAALRYWVEIADNPTLAIKHRGKFRALTA